MSCCLLHRRQSYWSHSPAGHSRIAVRMARVVLRHWRLLTDQRRPRRRRSRRSRTRWHPASSTGGTVATEQPRPDPRRPTICSRVWAPRRMASAAPCSSTLAYPLILVRLASPHRLLITPDRPTSPPTVPATRVSDLGSPLDLVALLRDTVHIMSRYLQSASLCGTITY